MKAQYMSTASRARKIIAVIWICAVGLSCVSAAHVQGVKAFSDQHTSLVASEDRNTLVALCVWRRPN